MATRKSQQRQSYGGVLLALENDPRLVAMPTGGAAGQVLAKNSSTAYDTVWQSVSGGGGLTPTASQTANYTASSGQLVLCNAASAGFTVTLPASPATGATVGVKKTDIGTYVVTVVGSGVTTIDGDSSCTLNAPDAAATFVFDGSNWQIQNTAIVNAGTDSLQQFWVPTYVTGNWYCRRTAFNIQAGVGSSTPGTAGSATFASSNTSYVPVFLHRAVTIDTVGIVTGPNAPTAGATVALGLYTNTAANLPGTKLTTWPTVSPTAAQTAYTTAVTAGTGNVIPKGWNWFGLALNATSVGSITTVPGNCGVVGGPSAGVSTLTYAFQQYAASPFLYWESGSTLPATATPSAITMIGTGGGPEVFFRVLS